MRKINGAKVGKRQRAFSGQPSVIFVARQFPHPRSWLFPRTFSRADCGIIAARRRTDRCAYQVNPSSGFREPGTGERPAPSRVQDPWHWGPIVTLARGQSWQPSEAGRGRARAPREGKAASMRPSDSITSWGPPGGWGGGGWGGTKKKKPQNMILTFRRGWGGSPPPPPPPPPPTTTPSRGGLPFCRHEILFVPGDS